MPSHNVIGWSTLLLHHFRRIAALLSGWRYTVIHATYPWITKCTFRITPLQFTEPSLGKVWCTVSVLSDRFFLYILPA
ncbi:hypothetical protein EDB80DRAFT_82872 [Ilyonectria destructans]|nr:hypothetical protein EDB80DRAFT_82872 [Ilyonectria destructans]